DVRTLGLWGMGGTGKTTLAKELYVNLCAQFDHHCFLENVRGESIRHGLNVEKHAKVGYEELLESTIGYCGGNPLALKVLGANFRTKSKEVWESELEKLKKIPNRRIHDVLKVSFDDLDRSQQDIFLDIACFFNPRLINRFRS
ncbi:TMV resistance protein N-like, partial [Trifolium medium]|nr:TMV resistance protein N-like [Trifolium medium]